MSADQTDVEVVVFESATNLLNDSVDRNPTIISDVLTGLAPGDPARRKVDVTLALGTDGLLTIRAAGPHGEELLLEWRRPDSVPPGERGRPLPPPAD